MSRDSQGPPRRAAPQQTATADVGTKGSIARRHDAQQALDEIRALQETFLHVLDSSLEPDDMITAARRLLGRARDHQLSELAVPALEWVLERHLSEYDIDDGHGSPAERRVLELRRRGEHTCTHCLLPLPAVETIRRWQRDRALAAAWRDWLFSRVNRAERKAA